MSAEKRLAALLRSNQLKVVFAESCTAGLAAATLARIAGVSSHHCGGVVVYRNETKTALLGISSTLLRKYDAVSPRIAREMAERVLLRTPEAHYAAAVTGHLGPNAPEGKDGLVYVGIAHRHAPKSFRLTTLHCDPADSRVIRQRKVAAQVLTLLADAIESDQQA